MTDQASAKNLSKFMNRTIMQIVRQALRNAWQEPREAAFLISAFFMQRKASRLRLLSEKHGRHIPPFLIASITSRCNLFCKGCYARANKICGEERADGAIQSERWGEIFREAEQLGIGFILLAGGEPLLCQQVLEQAAGRRIIFPVFTNGLLLDEEYAGFFDRNRNLVPIISIEGSETDTDERRGAGTHAWIEIAMARLAARGLFFGVSITVTQKNLASVTDVALCRNLAKRGCGLILYVEYVPVADEGIELALDDENRTQLALRLEGLRSSMPGLLFLSFPGDEKLVGGCLAAGRGFFHINSDGGAEPCPFSPFSDTNLHTGSLTAALDSPLFKSISEAGLLLGDHIGGCNLFERESEVRGLLDQIQRS